MYDCAGVECNLKFHITQLSPAMSNGSSAATMNVSKVSWNVKSTPGGTVEKVVDILVGKHALLQCHRFQYSASTTVLLTESSNRLIT